MQQRRRGRQRLSGEVLRGGERGALVGGREGGGRAEKEVRAREKIWR